MNGRCKMNPWCRICGKKKYTVKIIIDEYGIASVKKLVILHFKKCKCKKCVYCSKKCQKFDWNTQHRLECAQRRR